MNPQDQADLFALIKANIEEFNRDPENFVPFGTDYLCERGEIIFDAEMDRMYRQHERDKLVDVVYQDGTHFCD